MNRYVKFHHYGLALKSFAEAKTFHKNLGYSLSNEVHDKLQKVRLIICESKVFPAVELVKPADINSPINNYLSKNNEIIYHVCYEIDKRHISISELFSKNRYICVSKPKPAILFNNRLVSFYYINNLGLIEILEK